MDQLPTGTTGDIEDCFTYRVSFDTPYVNTVITRYYQQRPLLLRPKGQAIALAAAFLLLGLYASLIADSADSARVAAATVLFGAALATFVPLLTRKGLLLRFKMNRSFGKDFVMRVSDRGIEIESEAWRKSTEWATYEKAVRYDDGLMLLRRGVINWLPDFGLIGAAPIDVLGLVSTKVRTRSIA